MLNPESPLPLYRQLADILQEKIIKGEYRAGERIPSEISLAKTFGIGRPTARQAVDLLVRKRFLLRKRGAGTFVRPQEREVDLFSLAGTMSSFHKKGISLTTKIVEGPALMMVPSNPENPFSGTKSFFFSRLSKVDKIPILIEDLYLHPEVFPGIDAINLEGRSLSELVERHYYMKPIGGKQNFRISYVTGRKAHRLAVTPNDPILLVNRYLNFKQADNAVYSELYCRTDQFLFSQEIGGLSNEYPNE